MTEKHKSGHDQPKKNTESDDDIIELSDIAIGITPEDDTIVELTEGIIDEAFVGFTGATSELIEDDERILDLSENIRAKRNEAMSQSDADDESEISDSDSDDITGAIDDEKDNLEEDITKEIDNYFGMEDTSFSLEDTVTIEKPQAPEKPEKFPDQFKDQLNDQMKEKSEISPQNAQMLQTDDAAHISSVQVDEAIERVIRTMFAEKINRILDEIIERTVTEEISQLKEYLLGIAGKKE